MIAYHNDPTVKADILEQLRRHREADELIQNESYWADGKGCAVGCTLHSSNHEEYEPRFGIPVELALIEDAIFEYLPVEWARRWPERFMGAIEPGADLSLVAWKFLRWLVTTPEVNAGLDNPHVKDAVRKCVLVLEPMTRGAPVGRIAAYAAAAVAMHVAKFGPDGRPNWSHACGSAAEAAECAYGDADGARRAVQQVIEGMPREAVLVSDKLIELIRQAPIVGQR